MNLNTLYENWLIIYAVNIPVIFFVSLVYLRKEIGWKPEEAFLGAAALGVGYPVFLIVGFPFALYVVCRAMFGAYPYVTTGIQQLRERMRKSP